jgi:tetratricopeptide (TPR) repeat protein
MRSLLAFIILLSLILSIPLQMRIDKTRHELGLDVKPLTTSAAQSLTRFMGGLRSIAAAYIWLKADQIHHDFYGNLQREQELMPLYRLLTWLDPHFEDAYYVGSYMLFLFGKKREGLAFAKEGVEMNPNSPKLHYNLAEIYINYFNQHDKAIKEIEEGLRHAKTPAARAYLLNLLSIAYAKKGKAKKATQIRQEFISVWNTLTPEEVEEGFIKSRHTIKP